jgi:ATP-dependent DNA helicase Q1
VLVIPRGHDFRSDYGQLHVLKKVFPRVPLLALTATAPAALAADVQRILLLDRSDCVVMRAPSDRPNIYYEVLQKPQSDAGTLAALYQWLKKHEFLGDNHNRSSSGDGSKRPSSGIIYCYSRKDADTMGESLWSLGVTAGAYHAGQEDSEKERVHSGWLNGSLSIVCATVAFGLGIDKPDVRFVIHMCLPKSTEAYYQESGRAGRDGHPARVALFFSPGDAVKMAALCHSDRAGVGPLRTMQRFAMVTSGSFGPSACRRQFLARELGDCSEDLAAIVCRSGCDVCSKAAIRTADSAAVQAVDSTAAALVVLAALQEATDKSKKVTFKGLVEDAVKLGKRKAKEKKKTETSAGNDGGSSLEALLDVSKCEWLCATLFLDDVLVEDYHFTAYSTIVYCAAGRNASVLNAGARRVLVSFPEALSPAAPSASAALSLSSFSSAKKPSKTKGHAGASSKSPIVSPASSVNKVVFISSDSDDKGNAKLVVSKKNALKSSSSEDEDGNGDGDGDDSDDDFVSLPSKKARNKLNSDN